MYNIFLNHIKGARKLKTEKNISDISLSIFRMLIQNICISNAEYINILAKESSENMSKIDIDFNVLTRAADGTCVDFITNSLTLIGKLKNNSTARFFFEDKDISNEPALFEWLQKKEVSLKDILSTYVEDRNDSIFGHGISSTNLFLDLDIIEYILEKLKHFLPESKGDDILYFPRNFKVSEPIQTLRLFDGNPTCYRVIKKTNNGKVKVSVKIQKTATTAIDNSYEVPNKIFNISTKKVYGIYEYNDWNPLIYLPERATSTSDFTGRKQEISELIDWFNDSEDSKRCLIYGDGGIGKTTLILEFLHRVLEGSIEVEWKPSVITFYTAKKTRWGMYGLESLTHDNVGVADVALHIAELLEEKLDNSWYQKDTETVIKKLRGLLDQQKIKKDEHLIILDNTETMAENDEDIFNLGKQINLLSRYAGRVILTSRRTERLEARPIETTKWSDEEGAEYIQKRGRVLEIESINKAGLPTLRRITRELNNKPLILNVFTQFANELQSSLDSALDKVKRLQERDLGKFLFADVWERFSEKEKQFLLLLTHFGPDHDQYFMQLASEKANLTFSLAQSTLEGSKGICQLSSIDGQLQITFNNDFMKFCKDRTITIDNKIHPLKKDIESIESKYKDFLKHIEIEISDNEQRAYLSRFAKAARKFFNEGNKPKCLEFYELAIDEDPTNIWLLEKYANTLFIYKEFPLALEKINKATKIDSNHLELQFTKGKILSRIKDKSEESIKCLDLARKLGKPLHLCELQKVYAYLLLGDTDNASISLNTAKENIPKDSYYSKFKSEAERLERKLKHSTYI
ncbi:hypothetical protein [Acinetobacter pittii]|uniref:hypothetical protein n=1 Tax=Acinetobacter pittii TaxID=48296 RepID=UPI003324EEC5